MFSLSHIQNECCGSSFWGKDHLLDSLFTIELPHRYHLHMETKLFVAENVTSGTIHQLTSKVLSRGGACSIKNIHTAPSDTGHGGVRRFRGWTLELSSC